MTYIKKPKIDHPGLQRNELGLTRRDYEGVLSTLCAGCGHDSVTAAITRACFELALQPHRIAKLSGIGCSSKTPAYFVSGAHGFNAVHGRMPAVATGANAANKELHYIGVSGDGDSLSIGLGQFCHAMRRNIDMLYIIENNGVYGLTKGQFSATADIGSKAKRGEINEQPPIDPVQTALAMGGTFVARSFSGDKEQLVPLIKAGLMHKGFALIDVLSPCVTFNDHEDSTKSYAFTRQHYHPAVHTDFVSPASEIRAEYDEGKAIKVDLHDGSSLMLRKVREDYDPCDRDTAFSHVKRCLREREFLTGLLYVEPGNGHDMHSINKTMDTALRDLEWDTLCPGSDALDNIMDRYR
jgi:2-oxoglutarate ferredoxin oxidoreductase subunit beta